MVLSRSGPSVTQPREWPKRKLLQTLKVVETSFSLKALFTRKATDVAKKLLKEGQTLAACRGRVRHQIDDTSIFQTVLIHRLGNTVICKRDNNNFLRCDPWLQERAALGRTRNVIPLICIKSADGCWSPDFTGDIGFSVRPDLDFSELARARSIAVRASNRLAGGREDQGSQGTCRQCDAVGHNNPR